MKIAFLQFEPALNDLQQTLLRLKPLLADAMEADLLVLPELANSGYNFNGKDEAAVTSEEVGGDFCSFLQRWSANTDTLVVTGLNERDGDILYNSSVLIDGSGVLGTYRKVHLFNREKEFFAPGNLGFPVFPVRGCAVAMLVCFDWIFPEAWRAVALAGAEIVCHPSNLVLPGLAQRGVPAHSLMNRIFCVTANRIGSEGDLRFTGRSLITNARGDVLYEAGESTSEVHIEDINLAEARDKQVTERNHLFNDRAPRYYRLK